MISSSCKPGNIQDLLLSHVFQSVSHLLNRSCSQQHCKGQWACGDGGGEGKERAGSGQGGEGGGWDGPITSCPLYVGIIPQIKEHAGASGVNNIVTPLNKHDTPDFPF